MYREAIVKMDSEAIKLRLLIKSKLGSREDYYSDDMYQWIVDSFKLHYPNAKVKDLKYLRRRTTSTDPLIIFKLKNSTKLLCCSNDLEECEYGCECCCWREITKIMIDTQTDTNEDNLNGKMAVCVSGVAKDLPEILDFHPGILKSVELYPFEQTSEMSLRDLGFRSKYIEPIPYVKDDDANNIVITWSKDPLITVTIDYNDDEALHYGVARDKKYVTVTDWCYDYQLGDGDTNLYRYTKSDSSSLIIENCGDVSSVLVFNF